MNKVCNKTDCLAKLGWDKRAGKTGKTADCLNIILNLFLAFKVQTSSHQRMANSMILGHPLAIAARGYLSLSATSYECI
jgi:hypothetical protein